MAFIAASLYGDDDGESSANASSGKKFESHKIGRCSNNFPLCYVHKTKFIYFSPSSGDDGVTVC